MAVRLVAADDADFARMLGEPPEDAAAAIGGFALPPGGVDAPEILEMLRELAGVLAAAGQVSMWMMVAAGEVVGLCGWKDLIDADGAVEIGFGVAADRRRRGHATESVARMVEAAIPDPRLARLTAESSVDNLASRRVLEANGFVRVGRRLDPDDGELDRWSRDVATPAVSPCLSRQNL